MSVETAELENNLKNVTTLFLDVRRPDELSEGKIDAVKYLNITHTEIMEKFQLSDADFEVTYKFFRSHFYSSVELRYQI